MPVQGCILTFTVQLDIIKVLLPTDAQENCLKMSIKIYIKTTVLMQILILLLKQISCALFGNKTLIMQRDITNVLTFSFKVPVILLKSYGNLNCVNRISKNTKYQIL